MTDLYSYLMVKVFGGFIQRTPDVLRAIDEFGGDLGIHDDTLTFTLPALFEFVRGSFEESSGQRVGSDRERYLRFRKSLYAKPTNRLLRAQGGRVEVVSANADHDRSVYRLVRDAAPE